MAPVFGDIDCRFEWYMAGYGEAKRIAGQDSQARPLEPDSEDTFLGFLAYRRHQQ